MDSTDKRGMRWTDDGLGAAVSLRLDILNVDWDARAAAGHQPYCSRLVDATKLVLIPRRVSRRAALRRPSRRRTTDGEFKIPPFSRRLVAVG
jgi:hypothetical protein